MRRNGAKTTEVLHKELSFEVVGCAQKVHRTLGPGFPENVYQKAMCYELMNAGIPFESEKPVEVFYDGKLCGQFRADIVTDSKIILELKALDALCDSHVAQAITYLRATGLKLAILMNFGMPSLDTRRVVL